MPLFQTSEYQRLVRLHSAEMCVERAAMFCRELAPDPEPQDLERFPRGEALTERELNLLGAVRGRQQGLRVHAALKSLQLPEGEMHIVDWNAQNGFHTMALIEVLAARNLIHRIKRISLIDPSPEALERAHLGVQAMLDDALVDDWQRSLPDREGTPPYGLQYQAPLVIHLLGDAFCRPGVNLPLLAQMIARPGKKHIVIVTQPAGNEACEQILEQFSQWLTRAGGDPEILCDISQNLATYTLDHQPVSLRAKILLLEPQKELQLPSTEVFTEIETPNVDTDTRWSDICGRMGCGSGTSDLIHDIRASLFEQDLLAPMPALAPYQADLVLIRPMRCMMLAKILRAADVTDEKLRQAADYLRDMRRLLAMMLPYMDGRQTVRQCIRLALILPDCTTANLPQVVLPGCVELVAPDLLHTEEGTRRWLQFLPDDEHQPFTPEVADLAASLLLRPWHYAQAGRRREFDLAQATAMRTAGPGLVLGAPGSGKTFVLLSRALERARQSRRPSLVVVPQATALMATLDAIQGIYADFAGNDLHLCAMSDLHRFVRMEAQTSACQMPKNEAIAAESGAPYGNPTGNWLGRDRRYHSIFVDDANLLSDYDMKHLREKWLAPGGEIVCAATSRDGRNIELQSESIIYLTHNYLENHELFTPLISHICRSINSSLPELPMEDTGAVMHFQLQTTDSEAIAVFLHEKMNREACASPETLITGESEAQLREIEAILREKYHWETTTTFARDKVLESLIRNTRNTRGALDLQNDSRRHRFWARREQLKMAMPGELTGFHMPCVVLLHRRSLPPDYRHLYRAVTRATRLLMIVSFP